MNETALPRAQDIQDTCLALHLQRAARVITRKFDDALRTVNITSGQYSLLVTLQRPKPPMISELAALLAMDRTTLTKNLKPLERRGLISARIDSDDARVRSVSLTSSGQELLARAVPLWQHVQTNAVSHLTDAEKLRSELRTIAFNE